MVTAVFGVDPAFKRVSLHLHLGLAHRQIRSGGDLHLHFHQIQAGHHFRNRVFHLDPGIHFHKVKMMGPIHQKFQRPGTNIIQGCDGFHGQLAQGLALSGRHQLARTFFNYLLLIALDRTIPFREVEDVTRLIPKNLDFNVLNVGHDLFQIHPVITKGNPRFLLGLGKDFLEFGWRGDPANPFAPTTGCRF